MELDYAPHLDGNPYDPQSAGGSVSRLRLYQGVTLVADVGPAVRIAPGRYRFTFSDPTNGTYTSQVTWRMSAVGQVFEDTGNVVTVPLPTGDPAGLIVSTEDVARDSGVPLPLSTAARRSIADAILAVQADVEAHLNQPITPTVYTEIGRWPYAGGWSLLHEPVVEVIAAVPDEAGTFTVTYRAGMDAANDPRLAAIRRYVRYYAAHSQTVQRLGTGPWITNVSVEGQSISYAADPAAGAPGGPPALDSLNTFRRHSVYTRNPQPPYGIGYGYGRRHRELR